MTNRELVNTFLMYQETKNLSKKSIEWYSRTLDKFLEFCELHRFQITNFSLLQARGYVHWLQNTNSKLGRKYAGNGINGFIRSVKVFFNYLLEDEFIEKNHFQKVKQIKTDKVIIQKFEPEEIKRMLYILDKRKYTQHRDSILIGIGLDNGTMFHERCFLIVEGATEMHALPQIFRLLYGQSMQSAGIKLINGENNIGVRSFSKFLNTYGRKVVFLLDNDCNTGPSRNLFTKESLLRDGFDIDKQVFFLGSQEFEDSFSDSVLAMVGNKLFPKESGTWTEEEIQSLRTSGKKFSNELQFMFRTSKPSIGYGIGQALNDVNQIPEIIKQIFNTAFTLAN